MSTLEVGGLRPPPRRTSPKRSHQLGKWLNCTLNRHAGTKGQQKLRLARTISFPGYAAVVPPHGAWSRATQVRVWSPRLFKSQWVGRQRRAHGGILQRGASTTGGTARPDHARTHARERTGPGSTSRHMGGAYSPLGRYGLPHTHTHTVSPPGVHAAETRCSARLS